MGELVKEAIEWQNLPWTVLLAMVGAYWVVVAFGFVDNDALEVDLDADADIDVDMDVDADLDIDADAHLDVGAGADGDLHADGGHSGVGDVGVALMRFVNIGQVPLTIVVSVMAVCVWVISVITNYYLNPAGSMLIAAGLFAGNFVASTVLTRYLTMPLKPLVRALKRDSEERFQLVGHSGKVVSGEVTADFGTVEVLVDGAPFSLQARVSPGAEPLGRGDEVLLVHRETDDDRIFKVRKIEKIETEKTHD